MGPPDAPSGRLHVVPIAGETCREYVNRLVDIDDADGVIVVTLKRKNGDWSTCVGWRGMHRGERAYAALIVAESARADLDEITNDDKGKS